MTRSSRTLRDNLIPFQEFSCIGPEVLRDLTIALGNSESFRDQYLLKSFLSKYPGDGSSPADTRAEAAYSATLEDEVVNQRTNSRLMLTPLPTFSQHSASAVFLTASHLIANVLGVFSYDIYKAGSFTSGASVGFPKRRSDVARKYADRVTCTPNARSRVLSLIMATPSWSRHLTEKYGAETHNWVEVVPGSSGFTVPKNGETDRFCCKEPSGNMQLQKALGNHIRHRLRSVGIDLNDQSFNRRAAYHASKDGQAATLDLKSASNSLTTGLVWQLLPTVWFTEFVAARSPRCQVRPGDPYTELNMISSMGNGFTFELETLVFWALCTAVTTLCGTPGRVLVYGDDIVVPTTVAPLVIEVLNYSGFRLNLDKSFWTGTFRESCGGHYIDGNDVTPIYVRNLINDTTRVLWLLNSLRKWGDVGGIVDERLWPLYRKIQRRYVDPRLWGGKRLSSVTSLATPHQPREALSYSVARKRTTGYPGLLRYFQYRPDRSDQGGFGGAIGRYDHGEQAPSPTLLVTEKSDACWSFGVHTPQELFDMLGEIAFTEGLTWLCRSSTRPTGVRTNEEPFPDSVPHFCAELG